MFSTIYFVTGDVEHYRAANRALKWILQFRRSGTGLAGFRSLRADKDQQLQWASDSSFITGIAGIGLTLLSTVHETLIAWDEPLLIDVNVNAKNQGDDVAGSG
jgi:hypothetical protein